MLKLTKITIYLLCFFQEKVHAELALKEVSQYNSKLKVELDDLKENKESLIVSLIIFFKLGCLFLTKNFRGACLAMMLV